MFVKLSLILPLLVAAAPTHADERLEPPGGPVYDGADESVAPPTGRRQRERQLRHAVVERFDADGDGRLAPRERERAVRAIRKLQRRMALRGGKLERLIRRFDLDGDGQVAPGEMPADAAQRLRRLDRNGDGWIDGRDFATRRHNR